MVKGGNLGMSNFSKVCYTCSSLVIEFQMYWANNTSVSKNLLQKVIEIEEKNPKMY